MNSQANNITEPVWKKGSPVKLDTARFVMTSLRPRHITSNYISWWNDPVIQDMLNVPLRNITKNMMLNKLLTFDNINSFHLGIFRKGEDDSPIGFVSIFVKPNKGIATINFVLGEKRYWGSRAPEEISPAVLDFVFGTLGLHKVCIDVTATNRSSVAMCERLGYHCEGILRSEAIRIGGGRADIYKFGILREEWEKH